MVNNHCSSDLETEHLIMLFRSKQTHFSSYIIKNITNLVISITTVAGRGF